MSNKGSQLHSDSEPKNRKSKNDPVKRKRIRKIIIYTLSVIAFLFLVVIPLLLNIFADRIIGRTLSEIVRVETNGEYELSFAEVSLNVFSDDISFDTLVLIPNVSSLSSDTNTQKNRIKLSIPKLHLKGASWIKAIIHRELIIQEFLIQNPMIDLSLTPEDGDSTSSKGSSSRKLIKYRNLYQYLDKYLDLFKIENFNFEQGSLLLSLNKPDFNDTLELQNLSLSIHQFHLDSLVHKNRDRLFFSDSLGLRFSDGLFRYRNKNNEIEFHHLGISSATGGISVKDISVKKMVNESDSIDQGWFSVDIAQIDLQDLDFIKAIENRELRIKKVNIEQPHLFFYPSGQKAKSAPHAESLAKQIFEAATVAFEPVHIGQIQINNASIKTPVQDFAGMKNFSIPDLSLTIDNVLLDSASFDERARFFFIDDVVLLSEKQWFDIPGQALNLSYQNLSFNTRDSEIVFDGLHFKSDSPDSPSHILAEIPSLKIKGNSFKQDFLNQALSLQSIALDNPTLKISSGGKAEVKSQLDIYDLYPSVQKYLKWIRLEDLSIKSAMLEFEKTGEFDTPNQVSAVVDFDLTGFNLDESAANPKKVFYSSGIVSTLRDVNIELPDQGFQVDIDFVLLDTKNSKASIHNFQFDTLNFSNISPGPDAGFVLAKIEEVDILGLDYPELYLGKAYVFDHSTIRNPEISMGGDLFKAKDKSVQSGDKKAIDYLLGKIDIVDGKFDVALQHNELPAIQIQKFNLSVDSLVPAYLNSKQSIDFSFIEADVDGISVVLPDSSHKILIDRFSLSSGDSLIEALGFTMQHLNGGIQSHSGLLGLSIPAFSIQDIPLFDLYHHHDFMASLIKFEDVSANYDLPMDQSNNPKQEFTTQTIKDAALQIFNSIAIDSIDISNAGLKLTGGNNPGTDNLEMDGMNLKLDHFALNSSSLMQEDNMLFAGDIRISVDNTTKYLQNNDLVARDFDLSTAEGSMNIASLELKPSSVNGETPEKMDFGSIDISGLDYFDLLFEKKLKLESLFITEPELSIRRNIDEAKTGSGKAGPAHHFKLNLHALISGYLHEIRAKDVLVSDARFRFIDEQAKDRKDYLFERVDFEIKNILIDSSNQVFDNKFLYSDDFNFTVEDYMETSSNGLYDYGAARIDFSSPNATLQIDSGYLQPKLGDSAFAAKMGFQSDRLDLVFDLLKLKDLRLMDFIYSNTLWVGQVELDGLHGSDFRSKAYPPPLHHFPKLPGTALQSMDFTMHVDSFLVSNSEFTYREYVSPALQSGWISFTDISLKGKNITNSPEQIKKNSEMMFFAEAKLMDSADLDLFLNFNLKSTDDQFLAKGMVNHFDLTSLNPMLEHVAFVKIKRGFNDMLEFNFSANGDLATGDMKFEYDKLHIRLIDKKTLHDKGFGESIASFIANTFVVRGNNPKFPYGLREGDIYFRRDVKKSFFNYLAKSALSGVTSTIRGGNEEKKEKRTKRKMERQVKSEGKLDDVYMEQLSK